VRRRLCRALYRAMERRDVVPRPAAWWVSGRPNTIHERHVLELYFAADDGAWLLYRDRERERRAA
jgi:hypothetical protein